MRRRRTLSRWAALVAAVVLALLLPAAPASAEDGSIAYVETADGSLRILVDVPAGAQVDLGAVSATLDGSPLDASASATDGGSAVKRTTILAIDTSNSMRSGGRFAAAKSAAAAYLAAVPDDVEVGIVSFDTAVDVALAPTTDRAAAQKVIDGLALQRDTLLYDAVVAATQAAGDEGQRTVLVLSDGADAGSRATLDQAAATITESGTKVDIVGLDLPAAQLAPLRTLAEAGKGSVITSTGDALRAAFANEAKAVASQVLVTAPVPDGFDNDIAKVVVTLPGNAGPIVAQALAPVEVSGQSGVSSALPAIDDAQGWNAPDWLLWVGLTVLAVGLVAAAVLLVPPPPAPMSIADRVTAYSTHATGAHPEEEKPSAEPVLDQARAAAAGVLERNSAMNERLTQRLNAAGSEFKPSEWLLVHIGVVFVAGLVGLLLGTGNLVVGVLFVVIGALLPPLYLRIKAGQRRKAFDNALPEVLGLISGALSAGLSLAQAVNTVVNEGPEPIASEFKRVLVEARIGVTLEDAFEGVAERYDSDDFRWAVMAIRIQRQVGGNLAELLTTVAGTMRERQYLRRHVRGLSAEGRLSAVILCALPVVFALYLFTTNREFLDPLLHDPRGWVLLAVGALMMSIGSFWMSRMVKVEI